MPIADRARHPRFLKFEPVAAGAGFSTVVVVIGVHQVSTTPGEIVLNRIRPHVLHRQGAAERRNRGFGDNGQRYGRARQRLVGQDRGNGHDMPGLLLAHLHNHLLCYEKVSGDVRADHHFNILGRVIREWLGNVDTRAVEEEIDAAELADGGSSHFYGGVLFADVAVNQNEISGCSQLF